MGLKVESRDSSNPRQQSLMVCDVVVSAPSSGGKSAQWSVYNTGTNTVVVV